MRIAIDARLNAYRTGGIPQYTRQLMAALAVCAADDQIISLQHHDHLRPLVIAPNVSRHPVYTPPHHRLERWTLPLELLMVRPSVLHLPDFIAPCYRCCPNVVTIHDLAFLRYPDILDNAAAAYYRQVSDSVLRADAVIAVSETTRQDIAQFLDLPPERIDVIYEAAAPIYTPLSLRDGETRVIAGAPIEAKSFMLFVSTLEPRKNLPSLLKALRICLDRHPARNYRLLVVGARGWRDEGIFSTVRELRLDDHVFFAGRVGQYDLRWLYNACRLYINPSLYEGFGLPLLEAMACGAACLASSSASLPEIGGDAVEYLPPLDIGAWADKIETLWDDEDRCQMMGQIARARAEQFSWQRAARETLAVYRRVVTGTPQPSLSPAVTPSDRPSADRLVTCTHCGKHLTPAPVEGTIVILSSAKHRIAPRAWVCTGCGHIELLAVPEAITSPETSVHGEEQYRDHSRHVPKAITSPETSAPTANETATSADVQSQPLALGSNHATDSVSPTESDAFPQVPDSPVSPPKASEESAQVSES